MKILDVAETYSPHGGGVRTYLHNKLARAAAAGHEAVIVAPGERDCVEEANGGRIVWLPQYRSAASFSLTRSA